jgi:uncharacterized integral membrane protein
MGDEDGAEVQRRRAQDRAEHMRELDKDRRSRIVKIGVALVLAVLFILFIIKNSNPVSESNEGVDFVFVTADVRLIWVFLVCALLGGLVGYLLGRPTKAQRRVIREAEGDDPRAGRGPEPRRPDDGER